MPLDDEISNKNLKPLTNDPEGDRGGQPALGSEADNSLPQTDELGNGAGAIRDVRSYFARHKLYVGADEDIRVAEPAATSAAEIAAVSVVQPPTPADVVDDLMLGGSTQKASALKAALRRELREQAKLRKKALIAPIATPLASHDEQKDALVQAERFVRTAFEGPPEVSLAVILHFIYQVKRKLAKLPVSDHLMPIFVSATQGVGKTRAVKRLLEPLAELSKSVLFSDIADSRSVYVFRHPVLVLDDMERLKLSEIPVVKNRVTGEEVNARGMMSNREVGVRQRATFIGTANESVMALVPDQTGHRRFYELTFRNANPATGGDSTIWEIINDTDFLAIWRLVDPFMPSPLDAVRDQVFGLGGPPRPKSKVHAWALTLDLDRPEFDNNTAKSIGVRALALYDLYCEDTEDAWMTLTEFGTLMKQATMDPNVPLMWPKRRSDGMYYAARTRRR